MGSRLIDLTGQVFGEWLVLERGHTSKQGVIHWLCFCSCGLIKEIAGYTLRNGSSVSCGCARSNKYHTRLVGKRFGRLEVFSFSHLDSHRQAFWLTKCDCGNIKTILGTNLTRGIAQSCGCLKRDKAVKNIRGMTFGRLLVLEEASKLKFRREVYWWCQCTCGNITKVSGTSLRKGTSQSCGCLQHEMATTHGLSYTREYKSSQRQKRREAAALLDSQWTLLMDTCLRNYQSCCVVCGSIDKLSVDHVIPLSKGGGLYPGNAVTLCSHHNSVKNDKDLDQLPIKMATKIREAAESFRVAWSGGF